MKTGQYVIVIGLLVQILWFGGFIFVAGVFHYRMRVVPTVTERTNWRRLMHVLYAASTLILVRSIFRVIEFAQGNDGYFMRSEVVSSSSITLVENGSDAVVVDIRFRFSSYGWSYHSFQYLPSEFLPTS